MTSLSHKEFDKTERKALRDLVPEVADAEAREELADLDRDFERWRAREIDSQSLIEAIHEFHQGGARRLYGLYSYLNAADAVARGIAFEYLAEDRLSPTLRGKLAERISHYARGHAEEHELSDEGEAGQGIAPSVPATGP